MAHASDSPPPPAVASGPQSSRAIVKGEGGFELTASFHRLPGAKTLIVELGEKRCPAKVLEKLQAKVDSLASEGKDQSEIEAFLRSLVEGNRLLPLSGEIEWVKGLLRPGDRLEVRSEKKGVFVLVVVEEEIMTRVQFRVPEEYPLGRLEIRIIESPFHSQVTSMFEIHVLEICKKCVEGRNPEESIVDSDPQKPSEEIVQKLVNHLQIRHDIKALHEFQAISRLEDSKKTRRMLKVFASGERKREQEDEAKQFPISPEKKAISAIPAVCRLLIEKFARGLLHESCAACGKSLSLLKSQNAETAPGGGFPQRTFCGHWFHPDCLELAMTKPPFGEECPREGCGRRLFHQKYTSDVKKLERSWAMQERCRREEEEVQHFLAQNVG